MNATRWQHGLRSVGVDVVDSHSVRLRCQVCAQAWSPNLRSSGRLPRLYYRCPNGCNEHLKLR